MYFVQFFCILFCSLSFVHSVLWFLSLLLFNCSVFCSLILVYSSFHICSLILVYSCFHICSLISVYSRFHICSVYIQNNKMVSALVFCCEDRSEYSAWRHPINSEIETGTWLLDLMRERLPGVVLASPSNVPTSEGRTGYWHRVHFTDGPRLTTNSICDDP